jgi:hypothetical protein
MNLPGETEAGSARDATMLRDNLAGASIRCLAARKALPSLCTLTTGRSHRTIDPHALKVPAPQGGIYTNGERRFSISG